MILSILVAIFGLILFLITPDSNSRFIRVGEIAYWTGLAFTLFFAGAKSAGLFG